jgi:hypothetical protein
VYVGEQEAADDVRKVFYNALTYNLPGSKVYSHAKTLSGFFENHWAAMPRAEADVNRPPSAEDMATFVEKCHRLGCNDME